MWLYFKLTLLIWAAKGTIVPVIHPARDLGLKVAGHHPREQGLDAPVAVGVGGFGGQLDADGRADQPGGVGGPFQHLHFQSIRWRLPTVSTSPVR